MSMLPPPQPPSPRLGAPPPPPPSLGPRRRRRWPVVVAVLVVLAIVGAATALVLALVDSDQAEVVWLRSFGGLDELPAGLRTEPHSRWTFGGQQATPQWAGVVDGDVFVVADTGDQLEVLRLAGTDGTVRWSSQIESGDVRSLDMAGGLVLTAVVRDSVVSLQAFDADTGATRWEVHRPGAAVGGALVGDGLTVGLVDTGAARPDLLVLDRDGQEIWSEPIDTIDVDGTTALLREGSTISVVDLATGQAHWRKPVPDGAALGFSGGQTLVAERQQVTSYDLSGTEQWHQALPADDPLSVVAQGHGLVLVLRGSGVIALSSATGERRWEAPPAGVVGDTAGTALTIRTTDEDVTLRVIDGSTGRAQATRILAPSSGVALAADVVYVGDGRGVTAYDRVTLAPLWSAVVASSGDGRVIQAVDGGVLVRDGDGNLAVLH